MDKRQRQLVDVAKAVDMGRGEHLCQEIIQDNLWGQITLDAHAARILQTAPMRRLRSITQLGFVDRIWSEATHTRYVHSRGSYHVARQVMTQLHGPGRSLKKWALSQKQIHTFLLAALLHDVGHYPFSHSLDGLRSLLPAHEQVSRMLIEQSELATILERDCHVSPARIADLIDPPLHPHLLEEDTLLRQLLSGACDVDKLDYVARDALACRYACGSVNTSALLRALYLYWPATQATPQLALAFQASEALRTWIQVRHRLYLHVYWHATNRAAAAMLMRAVQDALETELLPVSSLHCMDDTELLTRLSSWKMPESTQRLMQHLQANHLYQSIEEISYQAGSLFDRFLSLAQDARQRQWVECQLARTLARLLHTEIAEHEIIFDVLPPKQWELDGRIASQPSLPDTCVSWSQALELSSEELTYSARQHCPVRVLASPRLMSLWKDQAYASIIPFLEQWLPDERECASST